MVAPISILLSQSGPPVAFAAAVEAHRSALAAHRTGPASVASPAADALIESLIERVPASGPVATRGPDTFSIRAYTIVDDTPRSPEANQALSVLRETIK